MPKDGSKEDVKRLQVEFGRKLQVWLVRKRISQKAFAIDVGMDESRVSKICRGQSNITISTMMRVARALHVSISEFYSGREVTVLERKFPEDFEAFRNVFVMGDEDALKYVRKSIHYATKEARERATPARPSEAG
jgi:transcriptional regulator with XRE-family HTH domain